MKKEFRFSNYYVIVDGCDVLKFYTTNDEFLGVCVCENMDETIAALENGANPIEDSWEDGTGTTITLEGWN